MKNSRKLLLGSMLLAIVTLAACNNGGGGGGSSSALPGAVYGTSANGGYIGQGNWQGRLVVNPASLQSPVFQQLMLQLGMSPYTQIMYLNINLTDGTLPATAFFSLYNYDRQGLSNAEGSALLNASNNGMVINYVPGANNANIPCAPGAPCNQALAAGVSMLQITTQYAAAAPVPQPYGGAYGGAYGAYGAQRLMNVQITFRGVVLATGQLRAAGFSGGGQMGYNNRAPIYLPAH